MLTHPVLKACHKVEVLDGESAILLSERGSHLLTGAAFVVVSELLDGKRDVDAIVAAAAPRVSAAEVYYALGRLERLNVVREASNGLAADHIAFWDSIGVDPIVAARSIEETTLALRVFGDVSSDPVAASLSAMGFQVADDGNVWIVLTDDYLRPELAALNEECLRQGRPWLLARPGGSILWIGPLFRPGRNACWECMAQRMRTHRVSEGYVQWRKGHSHPPLAASYGLPSTGLTAAGMVVTEVAKWLARAPGSDLERMLVTFDLSTLATRKHAVVRRPQCPGCGDGQDAPSRAPQPIRLTRRIKAFTADGGHRSATPEATLARYEHLVSPLTGVVRGLEADSGTDAAFAPIYTSGFNPATKDDTVESLRGHFRGTSSGKGKTPQQAKASALCEAIERYCGVFDGTETRTRGSFASIDGAIRPNACTNFSAAQYAERGNVSHDRYNRVPLPFDDEAVMDWSPLWSLTEERFKYLPATYCYFGYPLPAAQRFCWADSNGCAAGNSLEEAILQGFFELVERDSIALWWFNRIRRPGVDLGSFDEPYFGTLQSYYSSLHRDLWVIDITTDLGVPSFAAMSRRTDTPAEAILLGFGSHFDARVAILRALTEMNQFLPVVNTPPGDPSTAFQTADQEALEWLRSSTLANREYLASDGTARRAGDYPYWQQDDLADDVRACARIVAERGMEMLVLDQTRPDIGLSVARVVVPGLRHFWKRLGPGRLYDVPVALGWMPAALPEDQLNPLPVPF